MFDVLPQNLREEGLKAFIPFGLRVFRDVKKLTLLFFAVTSVNHTSAKKAGNSFCHWVAAARTEVT